MLAFLCSILVFFLILSIVSNLISKREGSSFNYLSGNKDSNQIIGLLKLSGPIITEPRGISNYRIFNKLNSIYPSLIKNYLNDLKKQKILGLVVSINSPGGSVSATKDIYELFINFKTENKIPIYFHTSSLLASGSYWISLSGNKIFANYGSLIGSIGVKGPDWIYYNSPTSISSGILGNSVESPNGIKIFSNTSGKSKDIFNPFGQPTKNETELLQKMTDEIYLDFINIVSKSRKIEKNIITNEIGAMIYNTKSALFYNLIDSESNSDEVLRQIVEDLKIKKVQIISNNNEKEYDIFFLKFFLQDYKIDNNYKKIIEKKFCFNYNNEVSSVGINMNNLGC